MLTAVVKDVCQVPEVSSTSSLYFHLVRCDGRAPELASLGPSLGREIAGTCVTTDYKYRVDLLSYSTISLKFVLCGELNFQF